MSQYRKVGTSPVIAEIFQRAQSRHNAGEFAAAEFLYREVLARDPRHADSLHMMGVLALQVGRSELAAELIERAANLRPKRAIYHFNLANALIGMNRLAEAEASLRKAIRLEAGFAEAHNNLANLLIGAGRLREAAECLRRSVRLRPDYAEAHSNLGGVLLMIGNHAEAIDSFKTALRLRPDTAELNHNLGDALIKLDRLEEAEPYCKRTVQLNPNHHEAWNNLGILCSGLGRFAEADAAYNEAMRLRPDFYKAYNNRSNALYGLGRLDEAERCLRHALGLKSEYPEAHINLAVTLLALGRFEEAWPEYEWRWKDPAFAPEHRDLGRPMWDGGALDGRRLLLHAEQGLGDTIQLVRYASLAATTGRVILEVQPTLARLVAGIEGVERVIARGNPLPEFDLHCPLFSLPHAFRTRLDTIPNRVPYLTADPTSEARWGDRLREQPGKKIGLVWAGNPRLPQDRRRSIALEKFSDLAKLDGATFVSLQKGAAAVQNVPEGLHLIDWTAELDDFADTAALVSALDLVIGVDTAVIHLAGALGRPVWLLNRFDAEWRWLRDRLDCPWYPTLRQFRQRQTGDWAGVIAEVQEALARWLADAEQPVQTAIASSTASSVSA